MIDGQCGFARDNVDPGQCFAKGNTTVVNLAIYNYGITQGASEALDTQTFPLEICDITDIAVLRVKGCLEAARHLSSPPRPVACLTQRRPWNV